MTEMETEIKKLPADVMKSIFATWGVTQQHYRELEKKASDPVEVLARFAERDETERRMLMILASTAHEMESGELAARFDSGAKKTQESMNHIDALVGAGFIYLHRKRGRLNQVEDKVFLFPVIRQALSVLTVRDKQKLSPASPVFEKTIYKKYERDILALYEAGGSFIYHHGNGSMPVATIAALARAGILSAYIYDHTPPSVCGVLNHPVVAAIERREKTIAARLSFVHNHYALINDIERFLYTVEEHRIRKLKNGAFDFSLLEKSEYMPVTPGMTNAVLHSLAALLNLVCLNEDNELALNYERFYDWCRKDVKEKMDEVHGCYRDRLVDIETLKEIIDSHQGPLGIPSLTAEANRTLRKYTAADIAEICRLLMWFGDVDLGIDEAGETVSIRSHERGGDMKCLVNNNFEVVLINPGAFDAEFLYLLASMARCKDRGEIFTFELSEESVLRGKYFLGAFYREAMDYFIEALAARAAKGGKSLAKNIETTLRRWYDRHPNAFVRMSAVVIELKRERLDEIVHVAQKEGITIAPLAPGYALVTTPVNKRKLAKLLRKEKINVYFI
ncbi:MAG: hypothetical protein HZC28_02325 [Spirochaetes bacterium]|nr:hypothetical protein [Spirochaetota bacterium]